MNLLTLDYRGSRALHVCIVFSFTILLQELLRFPEAGWTGFAVMMIYAGFDNGTTLFRAYQRFLGMILGLFSGYLLWFLGHLDYRTLILIIPITIFFAYFLVGQAYSVPTVFTVNAALLGTSYFGAQSNSTVAVFIVNYTLCTLIAFVICVVFEYFWFGRLGMMNKFVADTENKIIAELYSLVALLNQEIATSASSGLARELLIPAALKDSISSADWLRSCIRLNRSLNEVNLLVHNAAFEHGATAAVGNNFKDFVALMNSTFIGIKALYSAHSRARPLPDPALVEHVQAGLVGLARLLENN